jgi:hypothetical protein
VGGGGAEDAVGFVDDATETVDGEVALDDEVGADFAVVVGRGVVAEVEVAFVEDVADGADAVAGTSAANEEATEVEEKVVNVGLFGAVGLDAACCERERRLPAGM